MSSSHAAELARAEAERAEVVEGDEDEALDGDETPQEGEPPENPDAPADQPPQPQEGMTEAKAEAIFKSLERWKLSNAREVEKRAGPMWGDLVPCPCCNLGGPVAGFIFPALPEPDQTMRRLAVLEALGGEPPRELVPDPDVEICSACDGWGMRALPSKVEGQKERVCTVCNSQGWRLKTAAPAPIFTQAPQPAAIGNGTQPTPQANGYDLWNRPPGSPKWGQDPAVVGWS